jgi:glyceraldehyde-3-phosphate dehydrogenase (ferredoxin)
LNHFVDSLGIDAIQMGGMLAWFLELVASRRIPPADFGLPPAEELHFGFVSDPASFDLVADSAANARYASEVAAMMLFAPQGEPFRRGMRSAAAWLDERYPETRPSSCAVYTAHGTTGCMVPNQYWVPGMLAPMAMMGKYFVYYGVDYLPPRELGKKCVERMVYELYSENSGVCRFHRKWVEAIVDEIIESHYKFPLNYKQHQFARVKMIAALEGQEVRFWEAERTVDVLWQFLENWERHGLDQPSLHDWVRRFRADKWAAARQFWEEVRTGIQEAIAAGPQALPDVSAPYQAARLDVMDKKSG